VSGVEGSTVQMAEERLRSVLQTLDPLLQTEGCHHVGVWLRVSTLDEASQRSCTLYREQLSLSAKL